MANSILQTKYIGSKYGKLTVLEFVEFRFTPRGHRRPIFRCRCECGNTVDTNIYAVRSGNTTSCGCVFLAMMTRHGKLHTAEYKTWEGMNARVSRRAAPWSHRYAERGISVCAEWRGERGFQNFLDHIGLKPTPAHSIDRIDNDGNYKPGNVRWATRKQQSMNTCRNIKAR